MTDDHREAGTVYPRFSVRFVTGRMILENQELFTINSSCFSMIIRHGTNLTENRVLTVPVSRIIRHVTNLTENGDKQFLLLYDHPSCNHMFSVRLVT
jgi:hypothetical protein